MGDVRERVNERALGEHRRDGTLAPLPFDRRTLHRFGERGLRRAIELIPVALPDPHAAGARRLLCALRLASRRLLLDVLGRHEEAVDDALDARAREVLLHAGNITLRDHRVPGRAPDDVRPLRPRHGRARVTRMMDVHVDRLCFFPPHRDPFGRQGCALPESHELHGDAVTEADPVELRGHDPGDVRHVVRDARVPLPFELLTLRREEELPCPLLLPDGERDEDLPAVERALSPGRLRRHGGRGRGGQRDARKRSLLRAHGRGLCHVMHHQARDDLVALHEFELRALGRDGRAQHDVGDEPEAAGELAHALLEGLDGAGHGDTSVCLRAMDVTLSPGRWRRASRPA